MHDFSFQNVSAPGKQACSKQHEHVFRQAANGVGYSPTNLTFFLLRSFSGQVNYDVTGVKYSKWRRRRKVMFAYE